MEFARMFSLTPSQAGQVLTVIIIAALLVAAGAIAVAEWIDRARLARLRVMHPGMCGRPVLLPASDEIVACQQAQHHLGFCTPSSPADGALAEMLQELQELDDGPAPPARAYSPSPISRFG